MKRFLLAVAALACPLLGRADPELVVAMRYLQAQGVSHSHLYLYREDGKLLRRLTSDREGQDRQPLFSPDGATIVFTRETEAGKTTWSIEPKGGHLQQLKTVPDWYAQAKNSPVFREVESEPETATTPPEKRWGSRNLHFTTSDRRNEITIHELRADEDDQVDGPGHGKHYVLEDLIAKTQVKFADLPGFEGVNDLLFLSDGSKKFDLLEPGLRVVFFGLHLNSTDGDTDYALDLNGRQLVRLSPNWATPIPLPGEAAFLAWAYPRLVPIPQSPKRANGSCLERWNAKLQKVRYAEGDGAAICYGFSMYRPGRVPAVVSYREPSDLAEGE